MGAALASGDTGWGRVSGPGKSLPSCFMMELMPGASMKHACLRPGAHSSDP